MLAQQAEGVMNGDLSGWARGASWKAPSNICSPRLCCAGWGRPTNLWGRHQTYSILCSLTTYNILDSSTKSIALDMDDIRLWLVLQFLEKKQCGVEEFDAHNSGCAVG